MKKFCLILVLVCAFGCKKKPGDAIIPESVEIPAAKGSIAFDSTLVSDQNIRLLSEFYRTNHFHTVWIADSVRQSALSIIGKASEDGLDPSDYNLKKLLKAEKKFHRLSEEDKAEYDVLLTKSLQVFFRHLYKGKVDPKSLYGNWDLKRTPIDLNKLLHRAIPADSLTDVYQKLVPKHVVYRRLKKALALLDAMPKDTLSAISISKKIKRNDSVKAVIGIKKRLMYWHDLKFRKNISAIYDRETMNAMRRFQLRHGLKPDGVVGMGTVTELNAGRETRRRQIIANMERWRWFPRELGAEYVIVNIPYYRLHLVKNGDTIDTRRVVVGKEERKTPVLSSTFSDVILNPTWTVPPTIIKEDLGPDAAKDTSYFTNRRLTIYDAKNRVISPKHWNPAKPNNYRYVQTPGDDNSLGNVKFNFQNRFTVYLHDTNHRDYFARDYRSLSSGCVRVQDPLPLAAYLIGDEKYWNVEKIEKVVTERKTTYIRLKRKIRIHQWYWTAWMNKRGGLEFRQDIYKLDEELYAALRK